MEFLSNGPFMAQSFDYDLLYTCTEDETNTLLAAIYSLIIIKVRRETKMFGKQNYPGSPITRVE